MASLDQFLQFKAEVDALTGDLRKAEYASLEERHAFDKRVADILTKMEAFWLEESAPAVISSTQSDEVLSKEETPETASEVLVKQSGDVLPCGACGGEMPCACFAHLPDPKISIEASGLFKIEFPVEYNDYDRVNFLAAMKLVLAKRKGK